MTDAGYVRIVIVTVNVAAYAHDQQRHLLVTIQEMTLGTVHYRIRIDGAGVYLLYSALKHLVALLETALIGTENALIFSGEGIAEAVLKDRA